jgi:hypothetical protein
VQAHRHPARVVDFGPDRDHAAQRGVAEPEVPAGAAQVLKLHVAVDGGAAGRDQRGAFRLAEAGPGEGQLATDAGAAEPDRALDADPAHHQRGPQLGVAQVQRGPAARPQRAVRAHRQRAQVAHGEVQAPDDVAVPLQRDLRAHGQPGGRHGRAGDPGAGVAAVRGQAGRLLERRVAEQELARDLGAADVDPAADHRPAAAAVHDEQVAADDRVAQVQGGPAGGFDAAADDVQ